MDLPSEVQLFLMLSEGFHCVSLEKNSGVKEGLGLGSIVLRLKKKLTQMRQLPLPVGVPEN